MRPSRPRFAPPTSLAVTLLCALLGAGCAAVPAGVQEAGDLRITYRDFKTGNEMVLVNESNPANQDLYSKPRDDANTKVAPDEEMLDLIGFAASKGFFDYSESLAADEIETTAIRTIAVNADGTPYSFTLRMPLGPDDQSMIQAFTDIQLRMLSLYNSIPQLQYISNKSGSSFFEQEQERQRQRNKDAMTGRGGNR